MTIRLVHAGWGKELTQAQHLSTSDVEIICPFIKAGALDRLLDRRPASIRVVTRFNLDDFAEGVSDIHALRKLLTAGAEVRGVKNLHAKVYVIGTSRAIVTSANLTEAALDRNHEFGMVAEDANVIAACRAYFADLWKRGGPNLSLQQLTDWDAAVARKRASGGRAHLGASLGDFGMDLGLERPFPVGLPIAVSDARQAFVKFLGEGDNRVPLSFATIQEIERAGCHWALAYPASKRPTSVKDDALMFVGRLTQDPNDIRIFGRAVGMKHVPGRDDATPKDIERRTWKEQWPRYIRVHGAEFVAGTMANGVSLNELMEALGARAFAATKRNAASGSGNIDPRKAYRQQAAVELAEEGLSWLSERLQSAFDQHGKVPQDTLDHLDWPVNCTQFPWTPICPRGDRNDDVQHEKDRSSFSR